jgi:hypothetical protein
MKFILPNGKWKSIWHVFLLSSIVGISFLLALTSLRQGHHWGDDFAGYIGQTIAIANADIAGYFARNSFTIQMTKNVLGPVTYPWGFPLFLLPIYMIFGLNIFAFKVAGILMYAIFLISFYYLAAMRLEKTESLLLTALFAFAPSFINGMDEIMSDIPFLAFSTISLVLIKKSDRKIYPYLAGASIFFTTFIRSNGILLLLPLFVEYYFQSGASLLKFIREVFKTLFIFGFFYLMNLLIFPSGDLSYFSYMKIMSLEELGANSEYYFVILQNFLSPVSAGQFFALILLIASAIGSIYLCITRDFAMFLFALLTMGLYIIWPFRQGIRFIYPVFPYLIFSAYLGLKLLIPKRHAIFSWALRLAFALMALLFLSKSYQISIKNMAAGRPEHHGPFDPYSTEMMEFIRQHTYPNDTIIYVKPRVVGLLTARMTFRTDQCAGLVEADYVFLNLENPTFKQIHPDKILECTNVRLEPVFSNERLVGYKITP